MFSCIAFTPVDLQYYMMRYIIKLINLLFVFSVPLLLITFTLALIANIPPLYEYEFNKYDVGSYTVGDFRNLNDLELRIIASSIPAYFNSGGAEEPIRLIIRGKELFNEKEKVHMVDVKKLVRLDYLILLITSSFLAAYTVAKALFFSKLGWRPYFLRALMGAGITLGLIIITGLMLVFNFEGFFLAFHLVSFTNTLWILDYATDNLINLFPSGFFFDAALLIAILIALEALALTVVSVRFLLTTRRVRARVR